MNGIGQLVTTSLLFIVVALIMALSAVEAKHWPDFSCYPFKETTRQKKSLINHRMGWNSCKMSFEHYKQECDKMCLLRKRKVIQRSRKEGQPFIFYSDAFTTFMLKELGYDEEHRDEAPQNRVRKLKAELEICQTKHKEFENMTSSHQVPCEPYINLFQCIDNAVGCE